MKRMIIKFTMMLPASILFVGCLNTVYLVPFPFSGRGELREVALDGEKSSSCLMPSTGSKVLVIPVHGVIAEDSSLFGENLGPGLIAAVTAMAKRDSAVKAVVLKIDSPGGTVTASDTIYELLRRYSAESKVPVYAQIDGVGASGAYYVAMSAKHIQASPTAITGSIGVIIRTFGVKGLLEKVGVQYRSYASGKNKDFLSPFREVSPEEEALINKQISKSYERFLEIILKARGSTLKEPALRTLADGRIYDSEEAQKQNLIDSVGYIDELLKKIESDLGAGPLRPVAYVLDDAPYNLYNVKFHSQANDSPLTRADVQKILGGFSESKLYFLWDGF